MSFYVRTECYLILYSNILHQLYIANKSFIIYNYTGRLKFIQRFWLHLPGGVHFRLSLS